MFDNLLISNLKSMKPNLSRLGFGLSSIAGSGNYAHQERLINTAIEKLLDLVHPENHVQIAFIKDALAGAVLIAASIAVVIAVLVFYPHIYRYLTIKPYQEAVSYSYSRAPQSCALHL